MKKAAKVPLLDVWLEAGTAVPLQQQLYARLRGAILLGHLPWGIRLPPSRVLARRLGRSRNTVLFAYEELAADALVSAKTGSGTRVTWKASSVQFSDPDGLTLQGFGLV